MFGFFFLYRARAGFQDISPIKAAYRVDTAFWENLSIEITHEL